MSSLLVVQINTYLHSATPSFRASSKSPDGSFSPRVSSIHARISFAADGVYLDMRKLRMSWSNDDTDAMLCVMLKSVYNAGRWSEQAALLRGSRLVVSRADFGKLDNQIYTSQKTTCLDLSAYTWMMWMQSLSKSSSNG